MASVIMLATLLLTFFLVQRQITTLFSSATGFVPFEAPVKGSYLEYNLGLDVDVWDTVSLYANCSYQSGIPHHWRAFDTKVGLKIDW
jgi:outer membrane autotransporter protein